MKDYSRFINILHVIETEFPVAELRYKGTRVWPFFRNQMGSDWFWDVQGTHEQNVAGYEASTASRGSGLPAHAQAAIAGLEGGLARLNAALAKGIRHTVDVMFMTVGYEYTLIDSKYYNKFYDPLKELLDASGRTHLDIETGFGGNTYEPKYYNTINLKDLLALSQRIVALKTSCNQVGTIENFKPFIDFLAAKGFGFKLDYASYVDRFEQFLHMKDVFSSLLAKARPRIGFVVCYYSAAGMAFLAACRELGIRSIEIQHSLINKYDWAWAWWKNLPPEGYDVLPRHLWTWGSIYSSEIRESFSEPSPPNFDPVMGGNLWIAKWLGQMPSRTTTGTPAEAAPTILYTVPFGDDKMLDELFPPAFVDAVNMSPPDWTWLARLHYKTDPSLFQRIITYAAARCPRLKLHHGSQFQLYSVFHDVDYHISQTSTTLIEAECFSLTNIVIGEYGKMWFREDIEAGYYLYADSGQQLYELIHKRVTPARRPKPLLYTGTDAAMALFKVYLDEGGDKSS